MVKQRGEFLLDRLRGQPVAGLGRYAGHHPAQPQLHLQGGPRRVEPGMGYVGLALGRARYAGEPDHLGAVYDALDSGRHRLPAEQAEQAGGGVAHTLDDVRQAEDRLLAGKALWQGF